MGGDRAHNAVRYSSDDDGSHIRRLIPLDELNAATRLSALQALPTPDSDFFVRSIFASCESSDKPQVLSS